MEMLIWLTMSLIISAGKCVIYVIPFPVVLWALLPKLKGMNQ